MKKAIITFLFLNLLLLVSCKEKLTADSLNKVTGESEKQLSPNPATDFEYALSKDGNSIIIKNYIGTSKNLVFPAEIEGIPVREVHIGIHTDVKKVFVPEGIEILPDYFCASQFEVEEVYLPDSIVEIGKGAFEFCKSLKNINLPKNLKKLGEDAFSNAGIETIELPQDIKTIERCAFYVCENLQTIILPENLEIIKELSFAHCKSLKSISLNKNIKIIESFAFKECDNLEEVVFPDELTKLNLGTTYDGGKNYYGDDVFVKCKLNLKTQIALRKFGYTYKED